MSANFGGRWGYDLGLYRGTETLLYNTLTRNMESAQSSAQDAMSTMSPTCRAA